MLVSGLNNILELRLERSASYQETIDIRVGNKVGTVSTIDGATIEDSSLSGNFSGYILGEPLSNLKMSLLSLLRSSDLTSTNGPDGFVSNDNIGPVLLLKLFVNGGELSGIDLTSLSRFSLL